MFRRIAAVCLSVFVCVSCAGNAPTLDDLGRVAGSVLDNGAVGLSDGEIAQGLKQALAVSSRHVVAQLGTTDGYNADSNVHIPLPTALTNVQEIATKVGLGSMFGGLETRINRAAEAAVPKAKTIFLQAISQMTLNDARDILNGPDDAATSYFKRVSGDQLENEMRPIIGSSLAQVGAVRSFDQLMQSYRRIPFAPAVNADLTQHVLDYAMDGIFFYVAREEKAIREDPLRRTTELLQRVFASAN